MQFRWIMHNKVVTEDQQQVLSVYFLQYGVYSNALF